MSDRYLDFANSGVGGWLTGALGLPRPTPLQRRTDAGAGVVGPLLLGPDGTGRMATTLERLARGGADLFYHGELAEEIAADFAAHGGLISEKDLAAYELSVAEPIWGSYRATGSRPARRRPAAC